MAEAPGKQFEVTPEFNEQRFKPFSLLVNADDSMNYEFGRIRVSPPFLAGAGFLEMLSDDVGVELRHDVTTAEATLLTYRTNEGGAYGMDEASRVRYTAEVLLGELGITNSVSLFKKHYLSREEAWHGDEEI